MKKQQASLFAILVTICSVLTAGSVKAQMSVDLIMDNFTSSVISQTTTLLNNSAVESAMRNANGKSGKASSLNRKVNLSYTPTKAQQQKIVQDLGNKLKARNAQAGLAFTNAFGPGKSDYSQLFAQMVQESGLPPNNAATALAAYLEIGYIIVNNVQDNVSITPAMDKALQRQAAGLLSQNKNLASPATIAKIDEELKLQTVVLYVGWQNSLKSVQVNQFRTEIAQQFKGMGLDLSKVRLTTQGFTKK